MLETIFLLAIFGLVSCSFLAIFAENRGSHPQDRILRVLGRVEPNEELPPLRERLLRPSLEKLRSLLNHARRLGSGTTRRDGKTGESAEKREGGELKGLQWGCGVLGALMLLALFLVLQSSVLMRSMAPICGFLIGYLLPSSWLKAQTKRRRQEIAKALPDVLDLLTVSVEAGLGFDAALLKVVEKQKGALAEELFKVLQEIKMGRPRRDALRDLGKRNELEELSNVVASLVQADQLGIPIAGVLRNQSKQIRQTHRQKAEEKAQKAPVKIMFPLVFFVFPSIFIVVLGPAAIQIVDLFTTH